jgi:hypothetical protein
MMNESLQAEAERVTAGTVCTCGKPKHPSRPFCWPCFNKIPLNLRRPLWGTSAKQYAVAWDEARDWLRINS